MKLQEKLEEISAEDRKKIEKMYYKLRKYGCKFCQARWVLLLSFRDLEG